MDDLIKRQDAIDAVSDCGICIQKIVDLPSAQTGTGWTGIEDDYPVSVKAVLNITAETGALETQRRVRELSPVQKTGKWITKSDTNPYYTTWWYECSECGQRPLQDGYEQEVLSDYCPTCGSRMEVRKNELLSDI